MKIIKNQTFDAERALYGSKGISVIGCTFDGPADGESAFKECSDVVVKESFFNLRYPFWHNHGLKIENCELTPLCRAALWYSDHITITNSKLQGIKALRECSDVRMLNCHVVSPEFGWSVDRMRMDGGYVESEYFMLRSSHLDFSGMKLKGKYSFQYVENAILDHCVFDTKDAFWHTKNVTVRNSVIKGEYLAWYSEGLTLENCRIIGTQPLCYCKNLTLIDCEMEAADFCFEKSEVYASVTSPVISIKNPLCGRITVPAVNEFIYDDPDAKGEVIVGG